MAIKRPTQKQIAGLVGGSPLSVAFNPETGALCVIAPSGQKRCFSLEEWHTVTQNSARELPSASRRVSPKPRTESGA